MHTEDELRATFTSLLQQYKINLVIDPVDYEIHSPAALDVEHDEQGNLVGIGVYDGRNAYYFTETRLNVLSEVLQKLRLIAHNGVGDFECLRQWGIPVSDAQLVWDTYLIGHIADSSLGSYGLKDMAKRELGIIYPEYDEIVGTHRRKTKKQPACPRVVSDCCGRRTLDKWPKDIVGAYCIMDCFVTYGNKERQMECIQH